MVALSTNPSASAHPESSIAADLARDAAGLLWQAVRLPVLALLVIVEPIARLVLSGLAILGVLTAFLFEFSGAAPNFPFWQTLGISLGCVLALAAYYWLLRLLSQ